MRCKYITKYGNRCLREFEGKGKYCWQHPCCKTSTTKTSKTSKVKIRAIAAEVCTEVSTKVCSDVCETIAKKTLETDRAVVIDNLNKRLDVLSNEIEAQLKTSNDFENILKAINLLEEKSTEDHDDIEKIKNSLNELEDYLAKFEQKPDLTKPDLIKPDLTKPDLNKN
jgi:uncharacterized protein with von Willebrand factor type A (vWA) domain